MQEQYLKLRILSEMFWDCQDFRKAMASKARSATVDDVVAMALAAYQDTETQLSKAMIRELRHAAPAPVLAWIAESPGIGEHLAARLIGVIGDPYVAYPMHWEGTGKDDRHLVADPPFTRNVAKLWAVCGYGDPARKRRAGMTAADAAALGNWKPKMILRLLAESCVKQPGTRYDRVYRAAREEYAGRVHAGPCPQCKGSSEAGQPWRDGHQHAAALRRVAKEILRDLWEAGRAAHIQAPASSQCRSDAQPPVAAGGPDSRPAARAAWALR
jgi:hypothetical protein